MKTRSPLRSGLAFSTIVVATTFLLSNAETARAQGHTPDPYNIVGEYNNQYEPYMYASEASQEGTLPNQNRLEERLNTSRRRSSSDLQSELDDLEDIRGDLGDGTSGRGRAGSGTPYYRALRDTERPIRPEREADDKYYASQRKRSEDYFKAMSVKDPKKRARLLRELNLENLRVSRTLSSYKSSKSPKTTDRTETESADSGSLDPNEIKQRILSGTDDETVGTRRRQATDPASTPSTRTRSNFQRKSEGSNSLRDSKNRGTRASTSPAEEDDSVDDILERSDRMDKLKSRTNSTLPRS